ncbi:unnamed protein product [Amoebophrya sp. A25]|nr:unnamed protein product [Amoebophrya sp. A25]|eukprot:GSA25T00001983001.1
MNVGGYKSASVSSEVMPNWQNHEHDHRFRSPHCLNPCYDTVVLTVDENTEKLTSIERILSAEPFLGMTLKWNLESPDAGRKKINFIALVAIAVPTKVYIFRTHKDTRLPAFLVWALREKKIAKCVLGKDMVLQKVNQRMQKTFENTPKELQECRKWARENLKERGGEKVEPEDSNDPDDDEFLWYCAEYALPHNRATEMGRQVAESVEQSDWETEKLTEAQQRKAADDAYYALMVFMSMRMRKERRNPRRNREMDDEIDKRQRNKGKGICVKAETDSTLKGKGICPPGMQPSPMGMGMPPGGMMGGGGGKFGAPSPFPGSKPLALENEPRGLYPTTSTGSPGSLGPPGGPHMGMPPPGKGAPSPFGPMPGMNDDLMPAFSLGGPQSLYGSSASGMQGMPPPESGMNSKGGAPGPPFHQDPHAGHMVPPFEYQPGGPPNGFLDHHTGYNRLPGGPPCGGPPPPGKPPGSFNQVGPDGVGSGGMLPPGAYGGPPPSGPNSGGMNAPQGGGLSSSAGGNAPPPSSKGGDAPPPGSSSGGVPHPGGPPYGMMSQGAPPPPDSGPENGPPCFGGSIPFGSKGSSPNAVGGPHPFYNMPGATGPSGAPPHPGSSSNGLGLMLGPPGKGSQPMGLYPDGKGMYPHFDGKGGPDGKGMLPGGPMMPPGGPMSMSNVSMGPPPGSGKPGGLGAGGPLLNGATDPNGLQHTDSVPPPGSCSFPAWHHSDHSTKDSTGSSESALNKQNDEEDAVYSLSCVGGKIKQLIASILKDPSLKKVTALALSNDDDLGGRGVDEKVTELNFVVNHPAAEGGAKFDVHFHIVRQLSDAEAKMDNDSNIIALFTCASILDINAKFHHNIGDAKNHLQRLVDLVRKPRVVLFVLQDKDYDYRRVSKGPMMYGNFMKHQGEVHRHECWPVQHSDDNIITAVEVYRYGPPPQRKKKKPGRGQKRGTGAQGANGDRSQEILGGPERSMSAIASNSSMLSCGAMGGPDALDPNYPSSSGPMIMGSPQFGSMPGGPGSGPHPYGMQPPNTVGMMMQPPPGVMGGGPLGPIGGGPMGSGPPLGSPTQGPGGSKGVPHWPMHLMPGGPHFGGPGPPGGPPGPGHLSQPRGGPLMDLNLGPSGPSGPGMPPGGGPGAPYHLPPGGGGNLLPNFGAFNPGGCPPGGGPMMGGGPGGGYNPPHLQHVSPPGPGTLTPGGPGTTSSGSGKLGQSVGMQGGPPMMVKHAGFDGGKCGTDGPGGPQGPMMVQTKSGAHPANGTTSSSGLPAGPSSSSSSAGPANGSGPACSAPPPGPQMSIPGSWAAAAAAGGKSSGLNRTASGGGTNGPATSSGPGGDLSGSGPETGSSCSGPGGCYSINPNMYNSGSSSATTANGSSCTTSSRSCGDSRVSPAHPHAGNAGGGSSKSPALSSTHESHKGGAGGAGTSAITPTSGASSRDPNAAARGGIPLSNAPGGAKGPLPGGSSVPSGAGGPQSSTWGPGIGALAGTNSSKMSTTSNDQLVGGAFHHPSSSMMSRPPLSSCGGAGAPLDLSVSIPPANSGGATSLSSGRTPSASTPQPSPPPPGLGPQSASSLNHSGLVGSSTLPIVNDPRFLAASAHQASHPNGPPGPTAANGMMPTTPSMPLSGSSMMRGPSKGTSRFGPTEPTGSRMKMHKFSATSGSPSDGSSAALRGYGADVSPAIYQGDNAAGFPVLPKLPPPAISAAGPSSGPGGASAVSSMLETTPPPFPPPGLDDARRSGGSGPAPSGYNKYPPPPGLEPISAGKGPIGKRL